MFAKAGTYEWLEQLGLPRSIESQIRPLLEQTSGVILFAGPAGSGKTTTIYSCMREIAAATNGARSLVSVEDPVEVVVPGVAQSQINEAAEFDLATAIRAMMRQDPEVIMVGEIRDRSTADAVFQAALTGHLVLTTFHASDAIGAVSRLLDMNSEPYLLRSAVRAVVSQRLLRKLCSCRSERAVEDADKLAGEFERLYEPLGCDQCNGTGYLGRFPVAEIVSPNNTEAGQAILKRAATSELREIATANGMVSQFSRAISAVRDGETSLSEVYRVFGRHDEGAAAD